MVYVKKKRIDANTLHTKRVSSSSSKKKLNHVIKLKDVKQSNCVPSKKKK